MTIIDPGIYTVDDDAYHADPVDGGSLSCTEARLILDCPARLKHRRDTGPETKREFDFGHAAHALVLGVGAPVVVVDYPDWRTKAAKEARDTARAIGEIPVLAHEWAQVVDMAAVLRAHPLASKLLDPERGQPEQSLVWRDQSGVMLRCRLDWLPAIPPRGRLIVTDYKTTRSAEPRAFGRAAATFGYHQQAAWYLDGVTRLLEVDDPAFVFIVQEREAPYLVSVFELDSTALLIGAERNRHAIRIYQQCRESDTWPAYTDTDGVTLVSLPRWVETIHDEEYHS